MKKQTSKTGRYIALILGIKVSSTEYVEVLNELLEVFDLFESLRAPQSLERPEAQTRRAVSREGFEARPKLVVTPNPEIIMAAQKSQELTRILNSAYLAVPDGVGLKLCGGVKEVIPGRVLAEELIGEAARRGMRVFLLGGRGGIASEAAKAQSLKLKTKNHNLKLKIMAEGGPWLGEDGKPLNNKGQRIEKDTIEKINKFKPHFLFVGFGPPKQEFWLDRNLPRLKVGIAMTVGGAFDYWAGIVPLPPKIVTQAGLEWLWRLITQPWRVGRIFTAVVRFPLAVFWYKLTRVGRGLNH